MQILNIRKGFEAFKRKFELFERDLNANSKHLKGIQSIRIQIWTTREGRIRSIWI